MWKISRFNIQIFGDKVENIRRSSYTFLSIFRQSCEVSIFEIEINSFIFHDNEINHFFMMTSYTTASTTKILFVVRLHANF